MSALTLMRCITGVALTPVLTHPSPAPARHPSLGVTQVPMLEQYMQAKYGPQWEAYRSATPYRLLPGVW